MATSSRTKTSNKPSLKSQGAGYSTTNRKGETTYYKSSKDAPGYNDTANGKGVKTSSGKALSKVNAAGTTIPLSSLTPVAPLKIPAPPMVANTGDMVGPGNAGLAGGLAEFGKTYDTTSSQFVDTPTNPAKDNFQALFEQATALGDAAYKEMGTAEDRLAKLEKANGLKDKQQAVNDYTAQLNTIVANRDAEVLSLEGQGRGITESIIGGQQAQINREAAIRALPVQAQLAAAQGNLQMAQEHIDKMFTVQSQDALAKYQYKSKLIDSVYSFATGQEQRRLDAIKQKEDRAYDMEKTNLALKNDWAKTAVEYGQSSLAGSIMKLDPKSANFATELASLQGRVTKPVAPKTPVFGETKNFGTAEKPIWKERNMQTGAWEDVSGISPNLATNQREYDTKKASIAEDISRASELLGNSLGIKSSAGTYQPDYLGGLFTGSFGVSPKDGLIQNLTKFVPVIGNLMSASETSSQKGDFLTGVSYIVNNQTFDKLTQLKEGGATFGALSDSERVAIGRAATDLAASATVDESGNITGFRGSEGKLVENLTKVLEGYRAAQDQLNIDYGVNTSDVMEASDYWNSL